MAVDKVFEAMENFGSDDPKLKKSVKPVKSSKSSDPGFDAMKNFNGSSDPLATAKVHKLNPEEFDFNLKANADNYKLRAQNQSFGEQLGKTTANLIPNIITGIGEQVGYLGALVTEWGDDRDYSNFLVEAMKEAKNPFGETYRENPEETFSLSDPAWWLNHGSGLIESVGSFVALGAGVGGLFAKAAQGAVRLGIAADIAASAGQTATAATLAYTEGAMAGYDVFKKTYETQYNRGISQGMSPEEADEHAKNLGAQSASTAVQLNTVLGTALNFTAVSPLFADLKNTSNFFRSGAGARAAGESLSSYKTRLTEMGMDNKLVSKLVGGRTTKDYLMESGKEGFEEVVNQFSQRSGEDLGESGKTKGFLGQFSELQYFFDRTVDSEGALNFVLGAIGGAGNTIGMDIIPLHRRNKTNDSGEFVPKMKDGQPITNENGDVQYEKKFYSGRTLAKNQRYSYFANAKDAIIKDIDFLQSKNDELQTAVMQGNMEKAAELRDDILGVHHLNSVISGKGENFKEEYKSYSNLDNTVDLGVGIEKNIREVEKQIEGIFLNEGVESVDQLSEEAFAEYSELDSSLKQFENQYQEQNGKSEAMLKGFAKDFNDNAYKEKAAKAIADLTKYEKWYQDVNEKLQFNKEVSAELGIGQMILARKIDADLRTTRLASLEQEVAKLRQDVEVGSVAMTTDKFNATITDFNNQVLKASRLAQMFEERIVRLKDILTVYDAQINKGEIPNTDELAEILAQHRIDFDPLKPATAVNQLVEKLRFLRNTKAEEATAAESAIADSLQFSAWKDKNGGSLSDYLRWLREQVATNNELVAKEVALEELSSIHSIADQELQKIWANPTKFVRKVKNDFDQLKKTTEKAIQAENLIREKLNGEHEQAARLERQHIEFTILKLKKELKAKTEKLQEKQEEARKRDLPEEGKLSKIARTLTKVERKIRSDIRDLKSQIAYIKFEINRLGGKLEQAVINVEKAKEAEVVDQEQEAEQPEFSEKAVLSEEVLSEFSELINGISGIITPQQAREQLETVLEAKSMNIETLKKSDVDALIQSTLKDNREKNATNQDEEIEGQSVAINSILDGLTPMGRSLVEGVVNEQISNGVVDWSSLNALVMMKQISQDKAQILLSAVEDMLNGNSTPVEEESFEETEDTQEIEEPKWPLPTPSDIPPVLNAPSGQDPTLRYNPMNNKSTTPLKVQRLDATYVEFEKDGNIYKESTGELNQQSDLDLLTDNTLVPGLVIRFEVDDAYSGTVNDDNEIGTGQVAQDYQDFVDDNNVIIPTEENIGEVPIKILEASTGRLLGYLPRLGWVTAKHKNSENYRNVVTAEDDPTGERDLPSIESHIELITSVRNSVVLAHTKNQLPVTAKISDVSGGNFPLNKVKSEDGTYRTETASAAELLPDKSLVLTMITGEWTTAENANGDIVRIPDISTLKIVTGSNEVDVVSLADLDVDLVELGYSIGQLKALAPLPNGKLGLIPLTVPKLSNEDIETVTHILDTYIKGNFDKLKEYSKLTGFNLETAEGLRRFLNQHYTWTENFSEVELNPNNTSNTDLPSFMFSISNEVGNNKRALIKIGERGSGAKAVHASLDRSTGTLNKEFTTLLAKGLKSRNISVVFDTKPEKSDKKVGDIKGINNSKPFQRFIYNKNTNTLQEHGKPYNSYNDYVKEVTVTNVDGRNQSPNGKHIYGLHPAIHLGAVKSPVVKEPTSAVEDVPTQNMDTLSDEELKILNDFGEFEGEEILEENVLSSENLQRILESTPMENRNGKTVEDVMFEMRNESVLPEDFNPFRTC